MNKLLYTVTIVLLFAACSSYEEPDKSVSFKKSQFYGDWYFKNPPKTRWHYDFISDYLCYRYEYAGIAQIQYKYKLWYVKGDSLHLVNNSKYESQTLRIHSISDEQLVCSIDNQIDTLVKN